MAVQIQARRGDSTLWTSSNPTLAEGEIGAELDTGRFKIGDGTTAWNSLGYASDLEVGSIIGNRTYTEQNYVTDGESVTDSIDALDIAVAGGGSSRFIVATRDLSIEGDQTISGFTFVPTFLIIEVAVGTELKNSMGRVSQNAQSAICRRKNDGVYAAVDYGVDVFDTNTNHTTGWVVINSDESITITWSKVNSGATGTAYLRIHAIGG